MNTEHVYYCLLLLARVAVGEYNIIYTAGSEVAPPLVTIQIFLTKQICQTTRALSLPYPYLILTLSLPCLVENVAC